MNVFLYIKDIDWYGFVDITREANGVRREFCGVKHDES